LKNSPIISFIIHPGADILLLVALITIYAGWKKIHKAQGELVNDGIYKYVRHPQYAGFMLIIVSFLIQWPTLITLVMGPVLIWKYNSLAIREENEMLKLFGERYKAYMKVTPRYFPFIGSLKGSFHPT